MGLKHLRAIEEELKSGGKYTRTDLKNKLNIKYDEIINCLSYLGERGFVSSRIDDKGVRRYEWVK